jgi:Pentapeptide repeats (8 copies)
MLILFITAGMISLLAATLGVLIALKVQSRVLRSTGIEHEAWQHSQEAHLHLWEVRQTKQALELEQKLTWQVQQVQAAWQRWETRDAERLAKLILEQKLAYLPRVEDVPIASYEHQQVQQTNPYGPDGRPPSFYRADLNGRDLSRRFLRHADLREAQLANTNLYMADLAGASLNGANLAGANLAGANFKEADLRGAILTGANVLVADLQGAILNGANLLGAHNLTTEQLNSAIFDNTTKINTEFDITLPHLASVRLTGQMSTTPSAFIEFETNIPISRQNGQGRAKVESN